MKPQEARAIAEDLINGQNIELDEEEKPFVIKELRKLRNQALIANDRCKQRKIESKITILTNIISNEKFEKSPKQAANNSNEFEETFESSISPEEKQELESVIISLLSSTPKQISSKHPVIAENLKHHYLFLLQQYQKKAVQERNYQDASKLKIEITYVNSQISKNMLSTHSPLDIRSPKNSPTNSPSLRNTLSPISPRSNRSFVPKSPDVLNRLIHRLKSSRHDILLQIKDIKDKYQKEQEALDKNQQESENRLYEDFEEQMEKIEEIREKIESGESFHSSQRLFELRIAEEKYFRMEDYEEAEKVRNFADTIERNERIAFKQKEELSLLKKEKRLQHEHQQRMNASSSHFQMLRKKGHQRYTIQLNHLQQSLSNIEEHLQILNADDEIKISEEDNGENIPNELNEEEQNEEEELNINVGQMVDAALKDSKSIHQQSLEEEDIKERTKSTKNILYEKEKAKPSSKTGVQNNHEQHNSKILEDKNETQKILIQDDFHSSHESNANDDQVSNKSSNKKTKPLQNGEKGNKTKKQKQHKRMVKEETTPKSNKGNTMKKQNHLNKKDQIRSQKNVITEEEDLSTNDTTFTPKEIPNQKNDNDNQEKNNEEENENLDEILLFNEEEQLDQKTSERNQEEEIIDEQNKIEDTFDIIDEQNKIEDTFDIISDNSKTENGPKTTDLQINEEETLNEKSDFEI